MNSIKKLLIIANISVLAACNSGTTNSGTIGGGSGTTGGNGVTIVKVPASANPNINGPRYQLLNLNNNSGSNITSMSIAFPDGVALETNPNLYSGTACTFTPKQTLKNGDSCLILLKSTQKNIGSATGNLNITVLLNNGKSLKLQKAITSSYFMYIGGYNSVKSAGQIYYFDGKNWNNLANSDGEVDALTSDNLGNLYAGGKFTSLADIKESGSLNSSYFGCGSNRDKKCLLVKYDSLTWTNIIPNNDGTDGVILSIATDSRNNLVVGGYFSQLANIVAKGQNYGCGSDFAQPCLIAKYNAEQNSWSDQIQGNGANNEIGALAFDSNNNLYSGGFSAIGNMSETNDVVAENVASSNLWSSIGSLSYISAASQLPLPGLNSIAIDSNNHIFISGQELNGVGNASAGNNNVFIAEYQNGAWSSFYTIPLGNSIDNYLGPIALNAHNDLYTVGYINESSELLEFPHESLNNPMPIVLPENVAPSSITFANQLLVK